MLGCSAGNRAAVRSVVTVAHAPFGRRRLQRMAKDPEPGDAKMLRGCFVLIGGVLTGCFLAIVLLATPASAGMQKDLSNCTAAKDRAGGGGLHPRHGERPAAERANVYRILQPGHRAEPRRGL